MRALLVSCLVCAACAGDPPGASTPRPDPLPPLPAGGSPITSERFRESATCAQCHTASDTALRDSAGRDISPYGLWTTSMMSLAGRDPFYLAVFQEELSVASNKATVEKTCVRCHGPAGSEESRQALDFAALTSGDSAAAQLGRDGVTCTLCHQIDPDKLGTDASFAGGFEVGYAREMYGPHANPFVMPMQMFVNFTPKEGAHVATSELCATCHTVIVGNVVEQATYLEWRSSSVAANAECQTCHVPTSDADGVKISSPLAKFPANLSPRSPIGRHRFAGGNAYMLRLIASAESWANTGVPAASLEAAAVDAEAHLATAAKLELSKSGNDLTVKVINQTGHKLPTGYPSRRIWLHVTVSTASGVVYESGGDGAAELASYEPPPHRDRITSASQVQVWQAVLVNKDGEPTHRSFDATKYGRDDRIQPAGFAPTGTDRTRTQSVGVDDDANFLPGSDTVTYALGSIPADATIEVELRYQTLSPALVDAIDAARTPAGTLFSDLARAMQPTPIVMARATL